MDDRHEQTDAEQNLYCLECGYNLRGLSGDPRRCPECGHENPMSELTLPAQAISRALRRMETAPTFCVGAAMVELVVAAFLVTLISVRGEPGASLCPGFVLAGTLFLHISAAFRFAETCGRQTGWRTALVKYHVYGVGAGIPVSVAIVVTGIVFHRSGVSLAISIIDPVLVLALVAFAYWARRDIKKTVDPLQRDLAVRIARETLRQEMQRPR